MANEYKLSYTAEEINSKLGQIDSLSEEIVDLKANGSGATEEQIAQIETNKNDIADIKEDLIELSQIEAPEIVTSVDEMTDPTKHYVMNGYIYQSEEVTTEGETISPNVFVPSTAMLNTRYSAGSDKTSTSNGYFFTDFIETPNIGANPYNVRLNWEMPVQVATDCKYVLYKADGTRVGYSFIDKNKVTVSNGETIINLKNIHITSSYLEPSNWNEVAKVKFQLAPYDSTTSITSTDIANLEIKLDANQVTTEGTTTQEWVNTGISYAPTFKTDLVGVLTEDNVIYLSDNLPSGTYTLKYGDGTYATVGTITVS